MKLLSLELRKQKIREKKNKSALQSKQLESRLTIELKSKLDNLLTENDRVLMEVNPRVLGEFINILSEQLLTMYDYEQVDKNKFIFYNKEITL